jgi:hypothetical protein
MAVPDYRAFGFLVALISVSLSSVVRADTHEQGADSEALFWQRVEEIRAERSYPADVARGTFKGSHQVEGLEETFHYEVDVPDSYDPDRMMDLHIYLHGGVGISSNRISKTKMNRLERLRIDDGISVYPSAWSGAKWWYESQTKNILRLINIVKQSYNIDENRVFLHGLSDGAGGAYFFASRLPTPFAGFVAYVGSPHVLRPKHHAFGTTFPGNFINKPIFALNTKNDHLFPADSVKGLFQAINDSGGNITFHAERGDHFGMRWLGARKPDVEEFIASNTRNPYPDSLYWQIDEGGEFKRIHWLVLNGTLGSDTASAVAANKDGNAVYLSSRNISSVTLLISPDHFDLSENIQVWSNRELVFDQKLSPDVDVLNTWYEVDNDKSMLFANEITIDKL